MATNELTESDVLAQSNPDVYARGEAYYRDGSVLSLARQGDTVHAEVQGSDRQPYGVTIVLRGDQAVAMCTCPYRGGDWCKHIVAAALTLIRDDNAGEWQTLQGMAGQKRSRRKGAA